MAPKKPRVDQNCRAFQAAVDVLVRPWAAAVLNSLQTGERRFSELAEGCAGVTDKVLSSRLKDLEARGLITRRVEAGPPVRVSYALTNAGRAFNRVAEAIELWGRELVQGATRTTASHPRQAGGRRHVANSPRR